MGRQGRGTGPQGQGTCGWREPSPSSPTAPYPQHHLLGTPAAPTSLATSAPVTRSMGVDGEAPAARHAVALAQCCPDVNRGVGTECGVRESSRASAGPLPPSPRPGQHVRTGGLQDAQLWSCLWSTAGTLTLHLGEQGGSVSPPPESGTVCSLTTGSGGQCCPSLPGQAGSPSGAAPLTLPCTVACSREVRFHPSTRPEARSRIYSL